MGRGTGGALHLQEDQGPPCLDLISVLGVDDYTNNEPLRTVGKGIEPVVYRGWTVIITNSSKARFGAARYGAARADADSASA